MRAILTGAGAATALALVMAAPAAAAPLATLDRNGSLVSIEPYAPNIVRVTIATDRTRSTRRPARDRMPSPTPPAGLTAARRAATPSPRVP